MDARSLEQARRRLRTKQALTLAIDRVLEESGLPLKVRAAVLAEAYVQVDAELDAQMHAERLRAAGRAAAESAPVAEAAVSPGIQASSADDADATCERCGMSGHPFWLRNGLCDTCYATLVRDPVSPNRQNGLSLPREAAGEGVQAAPSPAEGTQPIAAPSGTAGRAGQP